MAEVFAELIWKWCGGGGAARGGALGGMMAVALCLERTRARSEVGEVVRARLFLVHEDAVNVVRSTRVRVSHAALSL
jgi:hypothetical protein